MPRTFTVADQEHRLGLAGVIRTDLKRSAAEIELVDLVLASKSSIFAVSFYYFRMRIQRSRRDEG